MSAERVLVDTSVWVDYLRGITPVVAEKLDHLLTSADICIPEIVLAELLQGARSEREVAAVESLREAFTIIGQGPETWAKAGEISRRLRGRGRTIHLVDCHIAVIAEEKGCAVLTLDEHFREIQKVLPLRLL
ncbi:MAG: PIN domain-containing protein [Candidatus Aminicenantes bacterium]